MNDRETGGGRKEAGAAQTAKPSRGDTLACCQSRSTLPTEISLLYDNCAASTASSLLSRSTAFSTTAVSAVRRHQICPSFLTQMAGRQIGIAAVGQS